MKKRMLIDAIHSEETRVVIADESRIHEFDISAESRAQNKGNIYLAKVTRVEPSLQAAFVEYGGGRQGFLPFSEIHPDYYQIPVDDRKKLIEEAAAAAVEAEKEEEDAEAEANKPRNNGGRRRGRGMRRGRRPRPDHQNDDGKPNDANQPEQNAEATTPKTDEAPKTEAPKPETENAADKETAFTVNDPQLTDEHTHTSLPASIVADPTISSEPIDQGDHTDSNDDADDADDHDDSDSDGDTPPENADVETLTDDDEYLRRRKASFLRRYKIQEVIKRGQIMLIQVVKEERGNKGASLSTYISLAGRYCVLMPNSPKTGGISRKIPSGEDRKRLKQVAEEMRSAHDMSAIIRTAGIDRTKAEIKRDYEYLVKLWNEIREVTISSTAPAMVYEEADIIKRSLRDLYTSDIEEVVVAGDDAFKRAKDFMKIMMPSHAGRIKQHKDATPILYSYDVEEQLLRMHEPQVRLESGGSIVINPTEALVSIDVNSGRSTTERNVEETAVKTNLEAAQEVARQLRLRDLAGLIVIDFIDMFDYKHRRAVERQLKDALKNDRAKIQVGRISAFGLLEMSRQRLRPSIGETNTTPCPHCEAKGFVLSDNAQAIQLLRMLEKEASSGDFNVLKLRVSQSTALNLLNNTRGRLHDIEKKHNVSVCVEISDTMMSASAFLLERITTEGQKTEVIGSDGTPSASKRSRQRKRKRDRGGKGKPDNRPDNRQSDNKPDSSADNSPAKTDAPKNEHTPQSNHAKSDDSAPQGQDQKEQKPRSRRTRKPRPDHKTEAVQADRDQQSQTTDTPKPDAGATDAKTETKPARKPRARKKPEGAKPETAAKSEPNTASKTADKPNTNTDSKPEPKPTSAKPASKPTAKTAAKPANSNGDDLDADGKERKGWWRRIVE